MCSLNRQGPTEKAAECPLQVESYRRANPTPFLCICLYKQLISKHFVLEVSDVKLEHANSIKLNWHACLACLEDDKGGARQFSPGSALLNWGSVIDKLPYT